MISSTPLHYYHDKENHVKERTKHDHNYHDLAQFREPSVTVKNIPPQNYTPSMFWLRQYATVVDLFTDTFEYHQFHHKLINAIDGFMYCQRY